MHLLWNRTFGDKWARCPSSHCQPTDRNSKHRHAIIDMASPKVFFYHSCMKNMKRHWVKVLRPTLYKIGNFADAQARIIKFLGIILKKLNLIQLLLLHYMYNCLTAFFPVQPG